MLVKAFAKLNLCLEIMGRRSDGYHEVRTVMQAIDLEDEIEIATSDSLSVKCNDPALNDKENLAWRAAADLARKAGRLPTVSITIKKHIPVGMGLGGGSSDAAAVILALNEFWELDLPLASLVDVAAGLGSDVPFFLWAGAALASGRGDAVEPLPTKPGIGLTLVCPGIRLEAKTARLYSRLTRFHFSDGGLTRWLVQNLMSGLYSDELFHNAFESVAFEEFNGLQEVFDAVEAATGRRPHLTGAGPALFLMSSSQEEHARVIDALQPHGAKAYFVRTLGRNRTPSPVAFSESKNTHVFLSCGEN